MKIIFFRHSLLNRGGDKMVLAHAAALADVGHQVVLKTAQIDTHFSIEPRIQIEYIPFGKIPATICSAVSQHDISAIYIADIVLLSLLLSFRNKSRVLFYAQGYDEFNSSFLPIRWLIRLLLVVGLRVFHIPVFAVSEHLASYLHTNYNANVTVVPNGIDSIFFRPSLKSASFLPLNSQNRIILLHARLDHAKGFDAAIAALRLLVQDNQLPIEVWTVGEYLPHRLDFVANRQFGYVTADAMAQIMSSADVFLHPSRHEGFALAVLEAFASHCPVVTTPAVYFAQHEVNAMVAEPDVPELLAAYLIEVLTDQPLRERLIANAYCLAIRFTLDRCTSNFQEALIARFGTMFSAR